METQASTTPQAPKARRWPMFVALGLGAVSFVVSCSALMVAVPHPDQNRVAPVGTVPTMPMPIVTPQPVTPDYAWDVEHVYKDGQYQVGKDIYSGTWKSAGKVAGPMGCAITVRDSSGGIVYMKYGDGQVIIQVQDGQTVETSDCQTLTHEGPVSK
jgi:hypothetical protein